MTARVFICFFFFIFSFSCFKHFFLKTGACVCVCVCVKSMHAHVCMYVYLCGEIIKSDSSCSFLLKSDPSMSCDRISSQRSGISQTKPNSFMKYKLSPSQAQ